MEGTSLSHQLSNLGGALEANLYSGVGDGAP